MICVGNKGGIAKESSQLAQLQRIEHRMAMHDQMQRRTSLLHRFLGGQQQLQSGAIHLGYPRKIQLQRLLAVEQGRECLLELGGGIDGHLPRYFDQGLVLTRLYVQRYGRLQAQGMMSLATAASIWSGWNGLTTQALAPAACPSCFLLSWDSVVSMMTGVNL